MAKGSVNGMTGWLVTRYDLVRPLLTDPRLSSNPAHEGGLAGRGDISGNLPDPDSPFSHQMILMDAPEHTRLRRLVNQGFTARRVELLRFRVQEITNELVDAMPPGGTDVTAAFAARLPLVVIMEILGVAGQDRDPCRRRRAEPAAVSCRRKHWVATSTRATASCSRSTSW